MNNLSWFLYFAEVIPSLGHAAMLIFIIVLLVGGVILFVWTMEWYTDDAPKPWFGVYLTTLVVCLLVSVLTPSEETIYLIAGSEAGEAVVTSPEGQEILNDIHTIIKQQLNNLKESE